jgi:hypothetical protein
VLITNFSKLYYPSVNKKLSIIIMAPLFVYVKSCLKSEFIVIVNGETKKLFGKVIVI